LAAVIDAQHRLKIELANVRVLSLGTGTSKTCYGVNLNKGWGLMRGWKGREFISFIMSLQAQSTHNYLQLILKEDQLLRLDFESEKPLPLDDCSAIDDLVSRADKLFTHGAYRVRSL
jgi:bifunctional ADP-heptose synthase (sugar kinase/adenylyltransferase)